ncbi:MAG TPA: phospho-sugar mutase [Polyangiaceae bacterium]|nr:phospho-sugar mutase [Polyangiaceae bacterium]
MPNDELRVRAERWLADDPDPSTRAELRQLLAVAATDQAAAAELADRFAGPLEFGTAGLRGVLAAGPNRMNRAIVIRASWALAQELVASVVGAAERGVVVGGDARRLSRELTEDVAAVLAGAGLRVVLFGSPVPTPLVGFTVKRLGAAAGVVVTASHNPPEYSGYKVYWENAAQIVPPVDARIAARLAQAPPAREVTRAPLGRGDDARAPEAGAASGAAGLVTMASPDFERAYLDAVATLAVHDGGGDRSLRIVYTPLHGVGDSLARRVLAAAGFSDVTSVPDQREPDPAFPTVAFPNPEEPGSMDLAMALADRIGADLVLANDPDADRLAVAAACTANPRAADGTDRSRCVQLTGNEIGVLLGWYLLTERPATRPRAVVASIVSSPVLGKIARSLGVHYEETLTGFKWIASRAIALEREGYEFVFGYEEALGYCIGDVVFDKDGISAALLVAEMASVLRARGSSLRAELDAIAARFGAFASLQRSFTRTGAAGVAAIGQMMARLRASPPARIGAHSVAVVADYQSGTALDRLGGQTWRLTLPRSDVLAFELASGARVVARPSGTEPKAKFYFDVREDVRPGEAPRDARSRAEAGAMALADAFMQVVSGALA